MTVAKRAAAKKLKAQQKLGSGKVIFTGKSRLLQVGSRAPKKISKKDVKTAGNAKKAAAAKKSATKKVPLAKKPAAKKMEAKPKIAAIKGRVRIIKMEISDGICLVVNDTLVF